MHTKPPWRSLEVEEEQYGALLSGIESLYILGTTPRRSINNAAEG